MRHIERQVKVEEAVEDYIDEIAERIGIKVKSYPDVYWVGRDQRVPRYLLDKECTSSNSSVKKRKLSSGYIFEHNAIVIAESSSDDFSEEAAHFLHFSNSRINPDIAQDYTKHLSIWALIEAFGFFGSKLCNPSRVNTYKVIDPLYSDLKGNLFKNDEQLYELFEHSVYYYGYSLGEMLFYAYSQGDVSKSEVKNIFFRDFTRQNEPIKALIKLINTVSR